MFATIERGLFPSKPTLTKLPPCQRKLPSHVVNLARIKPISEHRRLQLVHAQRRSREKRRRLQRVQAVRATLSVKLRDYLALFARERKHEPFSTVRAEVLEMSIFDRDVVCDGQTGRDAIQAMWTKLATTCPDFRLTVVSFNDGQERRDDTNTISALVNVTTDVGSHSTAHSSQSDLPLKLKQLLNSKMVVRAKISAEFDADTGYITSFQLRLDEHDNSLTTGAVKQKPAADANTGDAKLSVNKASIDFILNK
ncbi:hypothetical protein AC1031_011743 [Aphanomyces cochlioides]|nr:hypothetical protein AC1031_011743 [Aphanomyces cochlioides]